MTKVTIIKNQTEETPAKKIEFIIQLSSNGSMIEVTRGPGDFKHIELISLNYGGILGKPFDIMFAHDGVRPEGFLVLGHFNDGVV